jgi:hypothetical protein
MFKTLDANNNKFMSFEEVLLLEEIWACKMKVKEEVETGGR